jgi:hypothetical protein
VIKRFHFGRQSARRHPSRFASHLRGHVEALEVRIALDARLVISELMADNEVGLLDEDGDKSDWIEIYNDGDRAADLNGWHLTDDPDNLRKWTFPAQQLPPHASLVVFASGKNRSLAGAPAHTNFRLSAAGDYLALVQPDGKTVAHAYSPEYPEQYHDIAFGLTQELFHHALLPADYPVHVAIGRRLEVARV